MGIEHRTAPQLGLSDVALVDRIARGDRAALARLYDRHAPALMSIGQRMLGSRSEAEDLLHDVFLEVWRAIRDYDEGRGTVRAWLCLRMRSRAIDRLRSAQRALQVGLLEKHRSDASRAPADELLLVPDRTRVRAAMRSLPDNQRRVIELGYFEGLSSSEIASRLSIPMGTVKSRVAQALGRLRTLIAPELEPSRSPVELA